QLAQALCDGRIVDACAGRRMDKPLARPQVVTRRVAPRALGDAGQRSEKFRLDVPGAARVPRDRDERGQVVARGQVEPRYTGPLAKASSSTGPAHARHTLSAMNGLVCETR